MEGKYKGRLYIPANHSVGMPKANYRDYYAHGYYTDDHGKTFKISASLNIAGSNEATAAFISKDGLYMNVRNQPGDIRSRIVAYSSNGGETFDTAKYDTHLIDPVCEGAVLNLGKRRNKTILAFVNASDSADRNNLTLKISFDEGRNWPIQQLIDGSQETIKAKKDYTAYADLIKLGRKKVGVFYEKENYAKMVFKQVKW
jgi:sialidase-1